MTDPLTIAYMAIGAQVALEHAPRLVHTYDGGAPALMSAVIGYAETAEQLAAQNPGVEGSFLEDVAQPLGQYIVEQIQVGRRDLDEAVRRHAMKLVDLCCSQEQER